MEENKVTSEEMVADVMAGMEEAVSDTAEQAGDLYKEAEIDAAEADEAEVSDVEEAASEFAGEAGAATEKVIEDVGEAVTDAAETAGDFYKSVELDAAEETEEAAVEKEAAEEYAGEASEAAEELRAKADDIVAKIKVLVKDGNVTFIRIRKDDRVILNLPMTVGIIGTVLGLAAAPWAIILATITTIGLKCTVEVEKKDGTVILIHGKEKE